MTKRDILAALEAYDAGEHERLLELDKEMTTDATIGGDAIMAISQNPLNERERFLTNAVFHGYLTTAEILDLAFPPTLAGA